MEKCSLGVRKGTWTKQEDTLLRQCIERYGEGKWHQVPVRAGLNRCRKSCRLRWLNYLRPNIKRGSFSKDEFDLIVRLHKLLGNKWSLIAGRLPGRTANDIKNFWNTHVGNKTSAPPPELGTLRNNYISRTKGIITTHTNIVKPIPWNFNKSPTQKIIDTPPCNSDGTSSSREEVMDDCIMWWSEILEITENVELSTGCQPTRETSSCRNVGTMCCTIRDDDHEKEKDIFSLDDINVDVSGLLHFDFDDL